MFCATNCLQGDSHVLLCHHNVGVQIILFSLLNDCPPYDSPVLQFRQPIQKEGEKPAPEMDIHISLHLTPLVASICGGGRRSCKCWTTSSLVKSILPQPQFGSYPFPCAAHWTVGRVAGLARAAPALPATHNLLHSAETKRHAGKTPINSTCTETRRERK